MNWSDIPSEPSRKVLRQFAAALLLFLLVMATYQGLARGRPQLGLTLAVIALVLGLLGLAKPGAIRWLFVGWMVAVFPIGWLVSQMVLVVMFYGMVTPVALFFRLIGRDSMRRKMEPGQSSYWADKKIPEDVRRYFRQY